MVVQIGGDRYRCIGVAGLMSGHYGVNVVHQASGEKQIRKDHDSLVTEPIVPFQRIGNRRCGHGGVGCFRPTESHAFPQDPGDFADVGISVGIGATAPDHQKQGIVPIIIGSKRGLDAFDALVGDLQQMRMNTQIPAQRDGQARMLGLKGVDDHRDIVFDMASGHQQRRQGCDAAETLFP